jgi:hypothetical protein
MAEITEASLKNIIAERLKAVHVEVTDMSGEFSRSGDSGTLVLSTDSLTQADAAKLSQL